MANACNLFPLVKGKRSKLYDELFKYTGKNRKLTNFLYALSLQKPIISKFTKKDFNNQDEIDFNAFESDTDNVDDE